MQRRLAVGPKGDVAKEGDNLDLLGDGNLPVVLRLPIEETERRVAERADAGRAAAMPFLRAKPSMLLTASSPLSSTRT
jgi:hypothetical protein